MQTLQIFWKEARSEFHLNFAISCNTQAPQISPKLNSTKLSNAHTTLLEKYPIFLFLLLRKPGGIQWSALVWGDLQPSFACVDFSRLSIVSLDGNQHLSELVFNALVGFHDGFLVIPVHPGLVHSDYGVHEVGVTVCGVQYVLWDFNTKLLLRCFSCSVIFLLKSLDQQTNEGWVISHGNYFPPHI